MRSDKYKLIKEARIKIINYFDSNKISLVDKNKIQELINKLINEDLNLKFLDSKTKNKLIHIILKDHVVTSKRKLNNILGRKKHLFHVVFPSMWPILTSVAAFLFLSGLLFLFNGLEYYVFFFFISLFCLLCSMFGWFRAIIDEATFKGHHTLVVRRGLIYGFWLFIASEVMLFFGLFWAFFCCSISPAIQVGYLIPADSIVNVSYLGVPLFNTSLLCCSSLSITLAHKGIIRGSFKVLLDGLLITIALGLVFLILQINEYKSCMFNISDGAYPSIFYMLTGLHGFHVFVGLIWLILSLIRILNRHFTTRHYAGFLFGIWYWHFVDIIWIIVYCLVYIWLGDCTLLPIIFTVFLSIIVILYVTNR